MPEHDGRVIIRNQYLPKPGKFKHVLNLRKRASEVRTSLGAKRGQVFSEDGGTGNVYVVWQCEYRSPQDRRDDVALVKKSKEFTEIRQQLRQAVDRFDRSTKEVV